MRIDALIGSLIVCFFSLKLINMYSDNKVTLFVKVLVFISW
jgi:hypothetical protein